MRDIQVPNQGGGNRINQNQRERIMPPEQAAKRFVTPDPRREYYDPRKKNNGNKYLAIGLFFSLLLIGVIFFLATFIFDGATITIKPLKKEIAISETYVISETDRINLTQLQNINQGEEVTVPKKITKKVSRKAEGKVTIYNDFDKAEQKFVKGTRLSTTDGKIFKLNDNVTVPGKSGTTAGKIEANVTADVEGMEYNIGATKFTIPGLKASPKYKYFYAESTTAMSGGIVGNVNEVSDADVQKARDDLRAKIQESLKEKLDGGVPEGFVYNKDILFTVLSKMEKVREDDETATYSQSGTGTAMYFKRDEIVKKIVDAQNANQIQKPTVKVLDSKDFTVSLLDQQEILNPTGPIKMALTGTAPVIFYPDKEAILEYYAGRQVTEFNDIAKKFSFVESANRVIRPFWNSKFPTNIAKIKVQFEE